MRHRQLLIVGCAISLAGLTWWLWAGGERGAEQATVIAVPLAGLGLLLTAIALVPHRGDPSRLRNYADELARIVARREELAIAQLLGDVGDPRPADVGFSQPLTLRWRTDGGDQNGSLAQITAYYRGLARGRLVVLGQPGAGKTVLAIQLIIDLLHARTADEPIPVRLSLPAFEPPADNPTDEELAARLADWLVDQVVALGVPRRFAGGLVERGLILPVLDGLDEMDQDDTQPDRAAAVVRAVNVAARSHPVVLTCRRARYDELPVTVQDATAVVLDPLTPATVRAYLAHRFPDGAGIAQRWQATADALADTERTGPDWPVPLVEALCSPWLLYLCTTAFADHGDPYEQLADLAPDELATELLGRLIPAAVARHPAHGQDADRVTHWLSTLAHHLTWAGQHGGSSSDILLHQLWRAAGDRVPRYLSALLVALPATLLVLLDDMISPEKSPLWLRMPFIPIVLVLVMGTAARRQVQLVRLSLARLRTARARRVLYGAVVGGLKFGFVLGLALGLAVGIPVDVVGNDLRAMLIVRILVVVSASIVFGIAGGLVFAVIYGLPAGLGEALREVPSFVFASRRMVRQGVAHDLVVMLLGLAIFGALYGALSSTDTTISLSIAHGVLIGVAGGLVMGFAADPSPWPRYFIVTRLLKRRGALPARPALFLDWAYAAGLMRLSGIGIQFRHRELQAWLVSWQGDGHGLRRDVGVGGAGVRGSG